MPTQHGEQLFGAIRGFDVAYLQLCRGNEIDNVSLFVGDDTVDVSFSVEISSGKIIDMAGKIVAIDGKIPNTADVSIEMAGMDGNGPGTVTFTCSHKFYNPQDSGSGSGGSGGGGSGGGSTGGGSQQ